MRAEYTDNVSDESRIQLITRLMRAEYTVDVADESRIQLITWLMRAERIEMSSQMSIKE